MVAPEQAEKTLRVMKKHPTGKDSRIIGEVSAEHPGILHLETEIGTSRIVDMISGEQLPRIC